MATFSPSERREKASELAVLLEEAGVGAVELAEEASRSPEWAWSFLRGDSVPHEGTLLRVSLALNRILARRLGRFREALGEGLR